MDQADMADKDILDFIDRAIAAARGIRNPQALSTENEIYCQECGEEILARRLEAVTGCKHCIDCAKMNELQEKGFGRTSNSVAHYAELCDLEWGG